MFQITINNTEFDFLKIFIKNFYLCFNDKKKKTLNKKKIKKTNRWKFFFYNNLINKNFDY